MKQSMRWVKEIAMPVYVIAMLAVAVAVYAGMGVGGGSQVITVDNATESAISTIVNGTNDATRSELLATNALLVTSIAGKVATNATLTALRSGDGSVLTNVTANTDLSRAGTNVLGGISFVMLDGTNLLAIVGTTTNQVYLAPYAP